MDVDGAAAAPRSSENIFVALEPVSQQAADVNATNDIDEIGQETFGEVEAALDAMIRDEPDVLQPGNETPETPETPDPTES